MFKYRHKTYVVNETEVEVNFVLVLGPYWFHRQQVIELR